MDVTLAGTGGPAGWPEPGCLCGSCSLARHARLARDPTEILIDGKLRIRFPRGSGDDTDPSAGHAGTGHAGTGAIDWQLAGSAAGYVAEALPGGLAITAPDTSRLLCASGPGAAPQPPADSAPYQVVLLDLLGDPAQLGLLRRRGLVTDTTAVAAIHLDHRVSSQHELARRCGLWRATPASDGDRLAGPAGAAPRPWRVLLLGGARSGKSAEAERRLAAEPDVTYLATGGRAAADDPEWAARIARHRARRPAWWHTVETTDIAAALRVTTGALLIDSIGGWLAAVLAECGAWRHPPDDPAIDPAVRDRLAGRIAELVAAWRRCPGHVVAVTDEVGAGVVPATSSGRVFRDELGHLNQILAAQSEEAALVVAGRVLPLPG
jgi:adenosylcobinamide kinase/adenosylcobinamide-phosphate guanylyltransferase